MHAAALVPPPDDPELAPELVPVPELPPAPLPDPDDPELGNVALEPSPPPLVAGDVPLLLLPQAERPVATARPDMARRMRRRECISLLRYP